MRPLLVLIKEFRVKKSLMERLEIEVGILLQEISASEDFQEIRKRYNFLKRQEIKNGGKRYG